MDPITHGLVGVALSAFSGDPVSVTNPLTIGAMLGAMSPDLDFVIRIFKDDVAYLEHHRGTTHTIPFLIGFSAVITLGLSFMPFDQFNIWTVFLWTLIGALSHTGLDILNSYGAKLFRKKYKANILTLYDPIITGVGLFLIFHQNNNLMDLSGSAIAILGYLLLRAMLRRHAESQIDKALSPHYIIEQISVMPSLKAFYKWDFVVHTTTHDLVGQYNPFAREMPLKILHAFECTDEKYVDFVRNTPLGIIFSDFSPNLHVKILESDQEGEIVLRVIDLRYFFKNEFLHQATLVIDPEFNLLASYFHPYSLDKVIPV